MLTEEQLKLRLGKLKASTIESIMKPKGLGDSGMTYCYEIAAEILTGKAKDIFTSKEMQWGIDNEPIAVDHFASVMGIKVTPSETYVKKNICGTPDGILNSQYTLEIKCPNSSKHLEFGGMLSGDDLKKTEPKYYWQMQTCMYLSGLFMGYFVTFDPRITNPKKQMFIFSVYRSQVDIDLMLDRVDQAQSIINQIIN